MSNTCTRDCDVNRRGLHCTIVKLTQQTTTAAAAVAAAHKWNFMYTTIHKWLLCEQCEQCVDCRAYIAYVFDVYISNKHGKSSSVECVKRV